MGCVLLVIYFYFFLNSSNETRYRLMCYIQNSILKPKAKNVMCFMIARDLTIITHTYKLVVIANIMLNYYKYVWNLQIIIIHWYNFWLNINLKITIVKDIYSTQFIIPIYIYHTYILLLKSISCLRSFYFSLVRSILEYGAYFCSNYIWPKVSFVLSIFKIDSFLALHLF